MVTLPSDQIHPIYFIYFIHFIHLIHFIRFMHVLAFIFIHSSSRIDAKILDKTTMKEQVQTPIICLTRTRNNIISSQPHFALQHLKSLKEKNMKNFSMKRWSKF